MNALEWKRKALGWHAMKGEGGGEGGGIGQNSIGGAAIGSMSDPAATGAANVAGGSAPGVGANGASVNEAGQSTNGSVSGGGAVTGMVDPQQAAQNSAIANIANNSNSVSAGLAAGAVNAANSGTSSISGLLGHAPNIGQLNALNDNGYGNVEGVNPNNMTGQTVGQMVNSHNFATYAMPVITGLITSQVPGASLALSLAKTGAGLHQGTISPSQAVSSFFGNLVGGLVNKGVMGALPPDVAKGISTMNQVSTLGKMLDFNLPSFNPGGMVAGAITGNQQPASSGPVNNSGASIDYGNYGGPSSLTSPSSPAAPAPAATPSSSSLSTNMLFNLSRAAEMGKAIRAGAMSRSY